MVALFSASLASMQDVFQTSEPTLEMAAYLSSVSNNNYYSAYNLGCFIHSSQATALLSMFVYSLAQAVYAL